MKPLHLFITVGIFILVAGCSSTGIIKHQQERIYPDGTVERTQTSLSPPKYPLGGSSITSYTNSLTAQISGSQDVSKIEGVKGRTGNSRIGFWICGIIMLLGVVGFAAPNYIISNKDALIVVAIGGAGLVILMWASAMSPIMAWLLPVVALGVGAYYLWRWIQSKP